MIVQILSDKEYAALISYLQEAPPRDSLIVRFMVQCGLRAGEVCNIKIDNVHRAGVVANAIFLPRGTTKSHKARYVDMPDIVRSSVASYMTLLQDSGKATGANDFLFTTMRSNNQLTIRDVHNITRNIMLLAIFRPVNPHTLRHTYATILLRYTSTRVVQMLLGHASVATTEIYTHPTSAQSKVAVDAAFTH